MVKKASELVYPIFNVSSSPVSCQYLFSSLYWQANQLIQHLDGRQLNIRLLNEQQ
jgi:hypothetical protein